MMILPQDSPRAGDNFGFVVHEGSGITRIQAYIGRQPVLETECPDPPCHEVIFIPEGARGSVLRIVATDSLGHIVEKTFTILGLDRGQSAPAVSAG